jgi:hypothetical protein
MVETYGICDEDFYLTKTKDFVMPKRFTQAVLYVIIRDYIVLNQVIVRLNDQVVYENIAFSGNFRFNWDVAAKLKQPTASNKFELMTTIPFNHVMAWIEYVPEAGGFTHYISIEITNRRTGKKVYQWMPGGPGYEWTGAPRCSVDKLDDLQNNDPLLILLWLMKGQWSAVPDNGKVCEIYIGPCGGAGEYWFTAQPTYDSGTSYNYVGVDARAQELIKKYASSDPVIFAYYPGDGKGYSASMRVALTAPVQIPTALTITASPTPVQAGQQCQITGKLTRTDTGAGIAGKQVTIIITGPVNYEIPVVTDAYGNYKTTIVFLLAGTYSMKPTFAGGPI